MKDMTLTQYVDLPNAFQVFKKVKQVFKDRSNEDEKLSCAARLRQFIQESVGHGQDPEEFPKEMLLSLEAEDREWFTRLVRKAGGLYREDLDQADRNPDAEEAELVHGSQSVDLKGRQDIEMAARFYPIELERTLTAELTDRIMGHV